MKKVIGNIDFWGATTSVLCAIHCAILPLLLSLGLISSQSIWSHPAFEFLMILMAVIFVYYSLIKGYLNKKVRFVPFFLAICGLILVAMHHLFHSHAVMIVVTGGTMVACAHFINLLFGKHPQN